jgi:hypothetical protein
MKQTATVAANPLLAIEKNGTVMMPAGSTLIDTAQCH